MNRKRINNFFLLIVFLSSISSVNAQKVTSKIVLTESVFCIKKALDGKGYYLLQEGALIKIDLKGNIISKQKLPIENIFAITDFIQQKGNGFYISLLNSEDRKRGITVLKVDSLLKKEWEIDLPTQGWGRNHLNLSCISNENIVITSFVDGETASNYISATCLNKMGIVQWETKLTNDNINKNLITSSNNEITTLQHPKGELNSNLIEIVEIDAQGNAHVINKNELPFTVQATSFERVNSGLLIGATLSETEIPKALIINSNSTGKIIGHKVIGDGVIKMIRKSGPLIYILIETLEAGYELHKIDENGLSLQKMEFKYIRINEMIPSLENGVVISLTQKDHSNELWFLE